MRGIPHYRPTYTALLLPRKHCISGHSICLLLADFGPSSRTENAHSANRFPAPPRLALAFLLRATAAAFDAFVAISLRRLGLSFFARASPPLRPATDGSVATAFLLRSSGLKR